MSEIDSVLREVVAERGRQDRRWGEQNHSPVRWLAVLAEEVGEVAEAVLGFDDRRYRAELVQAAAVCVAAIESLDRATRRPAVALAEEEG